MFDDSPSLAIRLIGNFCVPWFYGHGWLAPVYYGALTAITVWLKNRFQLPWKGSKPITFFVLGLSGCYGALSAALLCYPLLFMTESGVLNPIFALMMLSNAYGAWTFVRSLNFTWKGELSQALPALRRGLIVFAPSMLLLIIFAGNFGI